VALPGDFGIVEDGGELFQALAFDRRPAAAFTAFAAGKRTSWHRAASGDDTDMVAHCGEEFDGGERAVGDQHDVAAGEPAVDFAGPPAEPNRAASWVLAICRHRSA